METKEIWKPIKDFEGYYEINQFGVIRRIGRHIITKHGARRYVPSNIINYCIDPHGYYYVCLSGGGKIKKVKVHKVLMQSFVPNPENKPFIDHINTIKTDNRLENLRWVTAQENTRNPLTMKHIKDACATDECKDKQRTTKKAINSPSYNPRKVFQYTMDNVFIKEYDSLMAASRVVTSNPRQCCGNIKQSIDQPKKSAYGYKWYSKRIEPQC